MWPPTPAIRQQHCLPPPGVGNCFITEFLESEEIIIVKKKDVLQPDVTDVDVWGPGIKKLAWSWRQRRWKQNCFCFVSPWCVSPFHFQLPAADVAFHAVCQPERADCFTDVLLTSPGSSFGLVFVVFLINCRSVVNKHNKWDIIRLLSALLKKKFVLLLTCFRMLSIVNRNEMVQNYN